MSSRLQLDVGHLDRWRRHLVNAYDVKASMVFLAGVKLCAPWLSALKWSVYQQGAIQVLCLLPLTPLDIRLLKLTLHYAYITFITQMHRPRKHMVMG